MTVASWAWAMCLIRASDSRVLQATRRLTPGSPLIAVAGSAGVSSSLSAVMLSRAIAPARVAAWDGEAPMPAPWRTAAEPAVVSARAIEPAMPVSGRLDDGRARSLSGGAIPASGSESVRESITRASAIPSAMQWCIRMINAAPSPNPSTRYMCHSGRLRSSGIVIRSPTSSCSAARSPGAGSAR